MNIFLSSMDGFNEPFTRRMVRRVSTRRDGDRIVNEDFQRRCNILKAIDDPCTRRTSLIGTEGNQLFNESQNCSLKNVGSPRNSFYSNGNKNNENKLFGSTYKNYERSIEQLPMSPSGRSLDYHTPFELSNPNMWSEKFSKTDKELNKSINIDDDSREALIPIAEHKFPEPVQLLKIRERTIEPPVKMVAELKNIEAMKTNRDLFHDDRNDYSQTSIMSLTAAIEDLDEQIKNLEMRNPENNVFITEAHVEKTSRIYPVLEDVKFDSSTSTFDQKSYSHYKLFSAQPFVAKSEKIKNHEIFEQFLKKNENPENCRVKNDEPPVKIYEDEKSLESLSDEKKSKDDLLYLETPKASRKMPLLESTRKSAHSDSTKIKFATPNRIDPNSISTIGATADSPDFKDVQEFRGNDFFNDSMPYDVERFLEDALGDELYNTTITYAPSEPRDRTNSYFAASELISEDRTTPFHKKIVQPLKSPMPELTPKNTSTLNRSMDFYRSLSQRFKKKFRSGLKTKENSPATNPTLPVGTRETDRIRELLQEVNMQQTLMSQAKKALNVCSTMKEFADSLERIESERLLLLASLRRKLAVEEIKRIASAEGKNEKKNDGEKGEVTISDMSLNLRKCLEHEEGDMMEWFLVVVTQGLKVWATRPMSGQIGDSRIFFPSVIKIPDLMSNFKIKLEVYTLKVRKSTYNHEEKYRIRRYRRSTSCPQCPNILVSPTKLLKKIERPLSPKIQFHHQPQKNRNSGFALAGFTELFLHDLSLFSPWLLMLVPENSCLQGTIDLNLACRLHLSMSHEGFLNHCDEAGGFVIWNRRWCVLKGHTLMFWNYPREQESKEPLMSVDLINCVSSRIRTADRTICAKPRTLLIETARQKNDDDKNSMIVECKNACTVIRNLLSFDSVPELMEWSTKLNHVIMALREWNVIESFCENQVSEL